MLNKLENDQLDIIINGNTILKKLAKFKKSNKDQ
jgi:hypothetical protein